MSNCCPCQLQAWCVQLFDFQLRLLQPDGDKCVLPNWHEWLNPSTVSCPCFPSAVPTGGCTRPSSKSSWATTCHRASAGAPTSLRLWRLSTGSVGFVLMCRAASAFNHSPPHAAVAAQPVRKPKPPPPTPTPRALLSLSVFTGVCVAQILASATDLYSINKTYNLR